jgi:hypothetical protein
MIARPNSERCGRAEMMLRADELFEEFSSLPVMTVINALAAAGVRLPRAAADIRKTWSLSAFPTYSRKALELSPTGFSHACAARGHDATSPHVFTGRVDGGAGSGRCTERRNGRAKGGAQHRQTTRRVHHVAAHRLQILRTGTEQHNLRTVDSNCIRLAQHLTHHDPAHVPLASGQHRIGLV